MSTGGPFGIRAARRPGIVSAMAAKDGIGRYGERVAARHLTDAGLTILDRNWRCREGEVDVVAREGQVLVFVEVKTRSTTRYGVPAAAEHRRRGVLRTDDA